MTKLGFFFWFSCLPWYKQYRNKKETKRTEFSKMISPLASIQHVHQYWSRIIQVEKMCSLKINQSQILKTISKLHLHMSLPLPPYLPGEPKSEPPYQLQQFSTLLIYWGMQDHETRKRCSNFTAFSPPLQLTKQVSSSLSWRKMAKKKKKTWVEKSHLIT